MTIYCGEPLPGYPPCHLSAGHQGGHEHRDGRCTVGQMSALSSYPANDPEKGIRWARCVLFTGHEGPHETHEDRGPIVRHFT